MDCLINNAGVQRVHDLTKSTRVDVCDLEIDANLRVNGQKLIGSAHFEAGGFEAFFLQVSLHRFVIFGRQFAISKYSNSPSLTFAVARRIKFRVPPSDRIPISAKRIPFTTDTCPFLTVVERIYSTPTVTPSFSHANRPCGPRRVVFRQ